MIRIILLEDHAIVREGVRFLLDQETDMSVIAEFDSPEQLFDALPGLDTDILITDLDFERFKGIEILQHPSAITSKCRTIVL
jgi:DNA-binding NarL/FixJ family response regulator